MTRNLIQLKCLTSTVVRYLFIAQRTFTGISKCLLHHVRSTTFRINRYRYRYLFGRQGWKYRAVYFVMKILLHVMILSKYL
jgi:hypothetical protein